jgi:hypothetical protein
MKTVVGLLVLLCAVGACGGGDSSGSVVSAPTTLVTESFTGTVAVGTSDFHTFSVSNGGAINVTLTAAGPPSTIYMGIGLGTPSASSCAFLTNGSVVAPAGVTAQLAGTISAGTYCVSGVRRRQRDDAGDLRGDRYPLLTRRRGRTSLFIERSCKGVVASTPAGKRT